VKKKTKKRIEMYIRITDVNVQIDKICKEIKLEGQLKDHIEVFCSIQLQFWKRLNKWANILYFNSFNSI